VGANHPEVLSGKMSASDALKKVVHQLEVGRPLFDRFFFWGGVLISDGPLFDRFFFGGGVFFFSTGSFFGGVFLFRMALIDYRVSRAVLFSTGSFFLGGCSLFRMGWNARVLISDGLECTGSYFGWVLSSPGMFLVSELSVRICGCVLSFGCVRS
jgi:hypothetical protein